MLLRQRMTRHFMQRSIKRNFLQHMKKRGLRIATTCIHDKRLSLAKFCQQQYPDRRLTPHKNIYDFAAFNFLLHNNMNCERDTWICMHTPPSSHLYINTYKVAVSQAVWFLLSYGGDKSYHQYNEVWNSWRRLSVDGNTATMQASLFAI